MANVSTLHAPVVSQLRRIPANATEKDSQLLALRLLNKWARVRLSPEPFDLSSVPGKPSLFAVANVRGLFAAVTRNAGGESGLILSSLATLRAAFEADTGGDDRLFEPQRAVRLSGSMPISITFAFHESRLLVALADGSILVYATDQPTSSGDGQLSLIHTFPASAAMILSIQPNPKEIPEIVAVLRDISNSLAVELLDVQKLVSVGGWIAGDSPNATPTAISWSPHGKQLAIGLQGGNIVTFSPTDTATSKFSVPCPPDANEMRIASMQWLSTTSFHAIFVPSGPLVPDTQQVHFHTSFDSKTSTAQYTKFDTPYQPFPGLRPPGSFMVSLKGWDPYKTLLFLGDGTSSDIGLIGTVADGTGEHWHNLSLEETSVLSLPLDKDQNETIMVGLELDLTNTKPYRHTTASGEVLDLPSPPIIYAYASDGTVLGWFLLNSAGTVYPGMVSEAPTSVDLPVSGSITRAPSSDMHTTPISPSAPSGDKPFQPTSPPVPPSVPASSQPTVVGIQSPSFSPSTTPTTSLFGTPSVFGQSPFGQPAATTSVAFGQTPVFGSAAPTPGFGAFTSTAPAKFGQPTLGFGHGIAARPVEPTQPSESPEESMAEDGPSLGSLGLGPPSTTHADSKPSIFGNTAVQSTSAFRPSGDGLIKPAAGFGASTNLDQKSPFANPSPFATSPSTPAFGAFGTGAFGKSAFGTPQTQSPGFGQPGTSQEKPTSCQPAFGQSAFGQPAFGQSSFGQSTFSQTQAAGSVFGKSSFGAAPATSTLSTSSASGGAFGAFASDTSSPFGAFAKGAPSAKPVWATADQAGIKQDQVKSVFSGETATTFSTPSTALKTGPALSAREPAKSTPFSLTTRETTMEEPESRSPSPGPGPVPVQPPSTVSATVPGNKSDADGGNLTSTSATIKPAMGLFGEMPRSSPFFSPKPPDSKPVSAFAVSAVSSASTTAPPKPGVAPTFGSSSMPGGTPKYSLGAITPSPVATPTAPVTSAFSSFAGLGGFGAVAGSGAKSFSDLLRSGGGASKDPTKDKAPDLGPSSGAPTGPSATPSTTPLFTPAKVPPTPGMQESPVDKASPPTAPESKAESGKGKASDPSSVKENSYESISSSTSSSFVDVSADEGEAAEETAAAEGEADETQSFDLPSESEESEKEIESDGEVEEKPADALLPSPATARSPSTTPKAEVPKIVVAISPSPSPPPQVPSPSSSALRISPVRELSTTPPGSPVQDRATVPAPASKSSPPAGSPFSLPPRINSVNRPVRSSPLASTPLVADIEPATLTTPLQAKSAPPSSTAVPQTPASVGQWGDLTKKEGTAPISTSRPKTPSPLSGTTAPGLGDTLGLSSAAAPTTPGPPPSLFTFPTSLPPFTPSATAPSLFAKPTKPGESSSALFQPTTPTSTPFTLPPSLFSTLAIPSSSLGPLSSPLPVTSSPATVPPVPTQPKLEQGMQAECTYLLTTLTKELENLRELATNASRHAAELKKVSGVTHVKADLGSSNKWVFGDIKEHGRVLSTVREDISELKQQRATLRKTLRELDSNMLKALTRKEEIIRFNKARTDVEFAKMLKLRTLGPEYLEIQSQLRREVRAICDRVQKLEDHLQASKKRLQEFKTGKPKIRPPSLDTINRTLRNIDIAIEQQQHSVDELQSRISRLDISGGTTALRERRLTGSTTKRPLNVTPNVAVTTAAALNAERSAQKLKRALLAIRSAPLLNTKAASTSAATSFQTPRKAVLADPENETPTRSLQLPSTPMSFPSSFPAWSPPPSLDASDHPLGRISTTRYRAGTKHHSRPIPLKKDSPGTEAPIKAPTPGFNWGPMPPAHKPMTTLAFDLRQKSPSS